MTEAQKDAYRHRHVDMIYYTAYKNPDVSVHVRLRARDILRQIREGVYVWPTHLA
jgi:hypothetical protein